VGGVSERAGAKAGESNLLAIHCSFACRDGERHPGFPEGGALRGASSERESRSVRQPAAVSSVAVGRADDSGCPEGAEEGNVVGMRHEAYAPTARTRDRRMRQGDASFARSFDTCLSILTTHQAEQFARWWGVRGGITVGQTHASGRNQHWGHTNGQSAARRVSPLPQGRERATSEKEGGRGLRPREDTRARVWLPARRIVLAEVGRRRLASNKLGKRAPKRAVRVE